MFRALHYRNFRLYLAGQSVSLIGTWMQAVAQAWLVLELSHSSLMLGVVAFARQTPILIVTLFAGVIVDQIDRRKLIIASQTLLMLSAFTLAALTWTHTVRVEHVIALAAFNGLVASFDLPGRQAFLIEMVGRENLPNAIALNSMMVNGARVLGPAVAGVLIAITGVGTCFFLNGLSFLAVIWSLFEMDLPPRLITALGGQMLARLREGLIYVWNHRSSFYLLLLSAITNGFGITYTVLIPIFASNILKAGAQGYGFLVAAQGIGAVIGALMAARGDGARTLRQNLALGIFCLGGAIVAFSMSHNIAVSMLAMVFVGVGDMNYMATTNTMLQLFVSDDLRGRVMSLYTISTIGLAPIGSIEVGFLGDHLGPRIAATICGAIVLGCAVMMLTRLGLIAAAQASRDKEAEKLSAALAQ